MSFVWSNLARSRKKGPLEHSESLSISYRNTWGKDDGILFSKTCCEDWTSEGEQYWRAKSLSSLRGLRLTCATKPEEKHVLLKYPYTKFNGSEGPVKFPIRPQGVALYVQGTTNKKSRHQEGSVSQIRSVWRAHLIRASRGRNRTIRFSVFTKVTWNTRLDEEGAVRFAFLAGQHIKSGGLLRTPLLFYFDAVEFLGITLWSEDRFCT